MWTRGLMFGLAMVLVAVTVILLVGESLEQRAEQLDDTYTPPAVPKPFEN